MSATRACPGTCSNGISDIAAVHAAIEPKSRSANLKPEEKFPRLHLALLIDSNAR
jgi:hypothetical protein